MEEILYITPNGTEVSETVLRDKYGDRFEEFVSQGLLKKKDLTQLDTELELETGLLGQPDIEEEPQIDIPETEVGKIFKATSLNLGAGLARIPTFVKEKVISTAAELSPTIKEKVEVLNQLPFETREQTIDLIGQGLPGAAGMGFSKYSRELANEAQQILATTKQYDTSITEDIISGEAEIVGRGLQRLGEQAIGALPSVALALVPGGVVALGAGSAATKSKELQEEGKDLGFRTTVNALGTGVAEGVFELATRGLGKQAFKVLKEINKTAGKEAARETLTKIALAFGKGFGIEGSSEVATEGTEDLLDNLLLDEENKFEDNFFNYIDTFLIGGAIGGPISGLPRLGVKLVQNKQKAKIDKAVEKSKYNSLVEAFTPKKDGTKIEIDQLPLVSLPSSDLFLKSTVNGMVKRNEITESEGQIIKDVYDQALGIYQQIPSQNLTTEQQSKAAGLLIEQKNLLDYMAGKKPELVVEEQTRVDEINEELKNIGKESKPIEGEAEAAKIEEEKIIEETGEPAPVLEKEVKLDIDKIPGLDIEAETVIEEKPIKETIQKTVEETSRQNIKEQRGKIYKQIQDPKLTPSVRKQAFVSLIKNIQPKGSVAARNAKALINKVNKLNFNNPQQVKKTLNEITSTFETAKRRASFKKAISLQKQIKKKIKGNLSANVKEGAQQFLRLDPFNVKNLDEYISTAESLNAGLNKTRRDKAGIRIAPAVNLNNLETYTEEQIKLAEETEAQIQKDAFEELTGKSPDDLSINEIRQTLEEAYNTEGIEPDSYIKNKFEGKEQIVKESLKDAFRTYSALVDNQLEQGIDIFTGQEVDITPQQKSIVKRFMNMDLDKLNVKNSVEALDAVVNFATNSDTAGMQKIVEYYEGGQMAEVMANEGFSAVDLVGSGRLWGQNIASIPVLTEYLFKGQTKALRFLRESGFQGIRNGAAKAETDINKIINSYATKFSKTNPNNEAFNTSKNNVERGMVAFMRRSPVGSEKKIQDDFDRRKKLIDNSIIDLKNTGQPLEVARAEVYEEVFNKILRDSNNSQEVDSKADKTNLQAVEWITSEWAKFYPELKEVNINMYNNKLDNDLNYTSDAFTLLRDIETPDIDAPILNAENINRRKVYDKETGVFKENKQLSKLNNRYVNLSFDNIQTSRMRKALTDIYTAPSIQRVKGYIESDAFKKIVKKDVDRNLIANRFKEFVQQKRGNQYISMNDEKLARKFNRLVNVGVSRTLGSLGQYPKQLVPLFNTMVNAGGEYTYEGIQQYINKPELRDWLKDVGRDISNRGIETEVQLENINSELAEAPETKTDKAIKKIDDLQTWWLKKVLVSPDKIAANASWVAYYAKYMKDNNNVNVFSPSFDWTTHDVNEAAADFAQQQVDRQQNVSSSALQGEIFKSKDLRVRFLVKAFLPFSNFLLNQKSRMYADINTAFSKSASKQDRASAMRSLGGLAVETAAFNSIGLTLTQLTAALSSALGAEEKDREKINQQFQNRLKGRLTNVVSDVLSPLPPLDDWVVGRVNDFVEAIDKGENPYQFYESSKPLIEDLGLFSILGEKAAQFTEISGMLDGEYDGKIFNAEERQLAQITAALYPLYIAGIVPAEAGNIINYNLKRLKAKR